MQKANALKALNIIHKALMTGVILFASVCAYLIYSKTILPATKELDKILQVVALVLTAVSIFAGMNIFKKKITQIREMETAAKEKFDIYRSACIIQWALLEGPSLFCIACFFLTGNYAFLVLALVTLFFFAMAAPTKIKVLMQLQISESDLDVL
jgi:ABC-type multidrug transport system fused ATPase/permease subunit